ncbi:hypothetical protein [Erythrobacter cryptus]|uniref:hypothetical protein n=1 Tax=Erythrobacter cryptus TaxID=196588 RepID=UPI001FE17C92|nr:hypothetical protein [Erythrobacter cryptus]
MSKLAGAPSAASPPASALLTRAQEWALAVVIAVVTANAYYIHPIIGLVAEGFGVGTAAIGLGRRSTRSGLLLASCCCSRSAISIPTATCA